jgi:hypothetical protein
MTAAGVRESAALGKAWSLCKLKERLIGEVAQETVTRAVQRFHEQGVC